MGLMSESTSTQYNQVQRYSRDVHGSDPLKGRVTYVQILSRITWEGLFYLGDHTITFEHGFVHHNANQIDQSCEYASQHHTDSIERIDSI